MKPLQRVVESSAFTAAVVTVILANALVLGLQTYPGLEREYGGLLNWLNRTFLAIFAVELTIRIVVHGGRPWNFFRSGWNTFDFIAVTASFVPGLANIPAVLRLIRILRVVRLASVLPEARVVVVGLIKSLPPLASVVAMMTLVFFIWGMVGWLLFGDELPHHWGSIGEAMLSLFFVLTLAELSPLMREAMEVHSAAWLYFVSFVVTAVYLALNVLIGIVLNAMHEARELERESDVRDVK